MKNAWRFLLIGIFAVMAISLIGCGEEEDDGLSPDCCTVQGTR